MALRRSARLDLPTFDRKGSGVVLGITMGDGCSLTQTSLRSRNREDCEGSLGLPVKGGRLTSELVPPLRRQACTLGAPALGLISL